MAGVGLLNNLLRAASKVTIPAIINFLAFYLVGLPLGALLAFGAPELELGLTALWIGLDIGMATMVPKSAGCTTHVYSSDAILFLAFGFIARAQVHG